MKNLSLGQICFEIFIEPTTSQHCWCITYGFFTIRLLRPSDPWNIIRIFSLAAILCVFGVPPLNYFGQDMHHVRIPSASLETFTIGNMQEKSTCWLWVHCVVLYIIRSIFISGVSYFLLYMPMRATTGEGDHLQGDRAKPWRHGHTRTLTSYRDN